MARILGSIVSVRAVFRATVKSTSVRAESWLGRVWSWVNMWTKSLLPILMYQLLRHANHESE